MRLIIPAAAVCVVVIAVAAVALAKGTSDTTTLTSDEIRHNLVVDVCGESNGQINPVSDWHSETGSAASALAVALDSGALYLVMFHADSVANNRDIYRVQCYLPGGGRPYRNAAIAWSVDGATYEMSDAPPASQPPVAPQPSEPPVEPTATPIADSCRYAPSVDAGGLDCEAAQLLTKECGVHEPTFVSTDHGLDGWSVPGSGETKMLYTASNIAFGASVLSCGHPANGLDIVAFHRDVLDQFGSTFSAVPIASCALRDTKLVLDEQSTGTEGVCELFQSSNPERVWVEVTLGDEPPHYRLREKPLAVAAANPYPGTLSLLAPTTEATPTALSS